MPLKLNSTGGGSVTVDTPSTASTYTVTVPAITDTLVSKTSTDTLTNKTLTNPTITSAVMSSMSSSVLTSGTVQNSTSGTYIDFTGIPSWAKRITVMFNGVSLSGTSQFLIQLGKSSGVETTGYNGGGARTGGTSLASASSTAGFYIPNTTAATIFSGVIIITNLSGNVWCAMGILGGDTNENCDFMGGGKTLSGTLDRVRITTANGTDTFDAGSINIMYE